MKTQLLLAGIAAVTLGPAAQSAARAADGARPETFTARARFQSPLPLRGPYHGDEALVRSMRLGRNADRPAPLTIIEGDFDKDGVPDIVVGYGTRSRGILVLHRGNVDTIYPNSPGARERRKSGESTDSPFLSPALVFESPARPDHMASGDFDGDGALDIAIAAHGGRACSVLPGNGKGGFRPPSTRQLPGAVTALIAGEFDRADGLADIVVSVTAPEGAKLLVLESSPSEGEVFGRARADFAGSLGAEPMTIDLPADATDLVLGQMDDDYPIDLAVASGKTLVIVHGRDRLMGDVAPAPASSGPSAPSASPAPAVVERIPFTSAVRSLALGDFDADGKSDLALRLADGSIRIGALATIREAARRKDPASAFETIGRASAEHARLVRAKVSSLPGDDLVVVDPDASDVWVAMPAAFHRQEPGTLVLLDEISGAGRPRAVLPMRLNADALADLVILTDGAEGGSLESSVLVALTSPAATFTVTTTADSGTGSLRNAIALANANPGADTIAFNIAPPGPKTIAPTVTPLPSINESVTIDGTTQPGFAGSPIIELDGSHDGEMVYGLQVSAGPSVIRGLVINRWNIAGAWLVGGGYIEGNFVGTDLSGTSARPNVFGILIGSNVTVGGTTAQAVNVISGNSASALAINGSNDRIEGNIVGMDVGGAATIANLNGIVINDGTNNVIGGVKNVISGNSNAGVLITPEGPAGNMVSSNFVGVDLNGVLAAPNGTGIKIDGSPGNSVSGNLVSGNQYDGILIANAAAQSNVVFVNVIGNNSASQPLGNGANGVRFAGGASGNSVGLGMFGPNTISSNFGAGVFIESGTRNRILFNKISSNGGLGIDLGPGTGVTGNDTGDGDTGANDLQNFPSVFTASACVSNTKIQGSLASIPSSTFQIQLFSNTTCDPSGYGEGQMVISSDRTVTTDGFGSGSFEATVTTPLTGSFVTATATDALGNTSEFSTCFEVVDYTPGEATNLRWSAGSKTTLEWSSVPGATSYRLHRGVAPGLPGLLTTIGDACWRFTGQAVSTGPVLNEAPPPGALYWYLVRPTIGYCEGPAGFASAGPRLQNSPALCAEGGVCAHSKCDTGAALASGCDPCASSICLSDSFCCTGFWDAICIDEVRTICGSLTCAASQGACTHPVCSIGASLATGCDDPPVAPSCVGRICAVDSFCCTTAWDSLCVDEVTSVCGQGCF